MRPTGFYTKCPNDTSGEFLFPMRKHDGTVLDMNHKSLHESRRERLFLHKSGLLDQQPAENDYQV